MLACHYVYYIACVIHVMASAMQQSAEPYTHSAVGIGLERAMHACMHACMHAIVYTTALYMLYVMTSTMRQSAEPYDTRI